MKLKKWKKKSKFRLIEIDKKKYYFYEIRWIDITSDGGHATPFEFLGFLPSVMITRAYLFQKDKKYIRTFASYEENEELFSDRNVFPKGCIISMKKIEE